MSFFFHKPPGFLEEKIISEFEDRFLTTEYKLLPDSKVTILVRTGQGRAEE